MPRSTTDIYRERYTLHVLACLAASLLLLLAVVRLWPPPGEDTNDSQVYTTRDQVTIQMEEIVQTRLSQQTPPPPAPLPPIVVPDDRVLEEVELDFSDSFLPVDDPGEDRELREGVDEGAPTQLARVDTGPKPVRFVEPEYTRAARRKKIRAEVVVEVLVDERGRVQETKILERFLLGDEDDARTPVAEVGYGIEEASLSAAERWLFRPARQNGTPVRSYTTVTFSFGV